MILTGPDQAGRPAGSGSGAPATAGRPPVPDQAAESVVTDGGREPHQPGH